MPAHKIYGDTCLYPECQKRTHGHGLCAMHYERERRGTFYRAACEVHGCTRKPHAPHLRCSDHRPKPKPKRGGTA